MKARHHLSQAPRPKTSRVASSDLFAPVIMQVRLRDSPRAHLLAAMSGGARNQNDPFI